MDLKLKGKLALVSGSTAGIGFAIAEALAREGARVIVNGRGQAAVDKALAAIEAGTGAVATGFAGDLSEARAAEDLVRRHPGIEILVNNLGIFEPMAFEDIPDDDWFRFFDVNVLSGVRLARLCLPAMRKANWGRIVFISSESGVQIPAEMIHYGMTKTALLAVSRGLAIARGGGIGRCPGEGRGQVLRRLREGILREGPAHLAHQALRYASGGRLHGRLCGEPARLGHHRCCASRRWRRREERVLELAGRWQALEPAHPKT